MQMPEYFRKTGYKTPTDALHCPFQYAFGTDLPYFEYLHQNPTQVKNFNTFMMGARHVRHHWVDWFPVRENVLKGFSRADDDALLVDLGGGGGHDLNRFIEKYPEASGHLVLQDLPGVIAGATDLKQGIKPMGHDFFTPQPVKGLSCS